MKPSQIRRIEKHAIKQSINLNNHFQTAKTLGLRLAEEDLRLNIKNLNVTLDNLKKLKI